MTRTIDKKLEKYGFKKIREDSHGAYYLKENRDLNNKCEVAILRKISTDSIIQVYDPDITFEAYTAMNALTLAEMKLFLKKFKQMTRKYRW